MVVFGSKPISLRNASLWARFILSASWRRITLTRSMSGFCCLAFRSGRRARGIFVSQLFPVHLISQGEKLTLPGVILRPELHLQFPARREEGALLVSRFGCLWRCRFLFVSKNNRTCVYRTHANGRTNHAFNSLNNKTAAVKLAQTELSEI